MTDNNIADTHAPQAARDPNPEPGSSPAPAPARGPTLWSRIKSILALRTVSLRDDLEVALGEDASPQTADFSPSERAILQNVLKLSDTTVSDVMVPRTDIEAFEAEGTLGALVAKFRQVGHSRLPIYGGNLDNVVGFVHVKDVLGRITTPVEEPEKASPVKLVSSPLRQKVGKLDIVREVVFVPPLMPVGDLLQSMRASRVHIALVVDEYGGTDGLVTIEDLLEAVVGEIEDEHDELEAALIRKVNADTYIADARVELTEVREIVGPDFDTGAFGEYVDTLGGLVFDLVERLPKKGEIVSRLPGFDFEILQADARHIQRVKIKRANRLPLIKGEDASLAGQGGYGTQ